MLALTASLQRLDMSLRYLHQVGIAIDQLCNVLLGGYADETLSARMFRNSRLDQKQNVVSIWTIAEKVTNILFFWQDFLEKQKGTWTGAKHCERAFEAEKHRKHFHPEYQNDK